MMPEWPGSIASSRSSASSLRWCNSRGTRCRIALMVNTDDDTDDLVLQYRQAGLSVLEGALPASRFSNHGQRVVEGQRMIQPASDALLGSTRATNVDGDTFDFFVRQMWDWSTSADLDEMDLVGTGIYARICGWTLGPGARPIRTCQRVGRLPRVQGVLRPCHARLRRLPRRPERHRLQGAAHRSRRRARRAIRPGRRRGADRPLGFTLRDHDRAWGSAVPTHPVSRVVERAARTATRATAAGGAPAGVRLPP